MWWRSLGVVGCSEREEIGIGSASVGKKQIRKMRDRTKPEVGDAPLK